ncbi:hypothetical protein GGI42DRAFT_337448 [Trichoderma sp. SZMC 28013]
MIFSYNLLLVLLSLACITNSNPSLSDSSPRIANIVNITNESILLPRTNHSNSLEDLFETLQYCFVPWAEWNFTDALFKSFAKYFCDQWIHTRLDMTYPRAAYLLQGLNIKGNIFLDFSITWNTWDMDCRNENISQTIGASCEDIMYTNFVNCHRDGRGGYRYQGCLTYSYQPLLLVKLGADGTPQIGS